MCSSFLCYDHNQVVGLACEAEPGVVPLPLLLLLSCKYEGILAQAIMADKLLACHNASNAMLGEPLLLRRGTV